MEIYFNCKQSSNNELGNEEIVTGKVFNTLLENEANVVIDKSSKFGLECRKKLKKLIRNYLNLKRTNNKEKKMEKCLRNYN
jgi:hypothetical protein